MTWDWIVCIYPLSNQINIDLYTSTEYGVSEQHYKQRMCLWTQNARRKIDLSCWSSCNISFSLKKIPGQNAHEIATSIICIVGHDFAKCKRIPLQKNVQMGFRWMIFFRAVHCVCRFAGGRSYMYLLCLRFHGRRQKILQGGQTR